MPCAGQSRQSAAVSFSQLHCADQLCQSTAAAAFAVQLWWRADALLNGAVTRHAGHAVTRGAVQASSVPLKMVSGHLEMMSVHLEMDSVHPEMVSVHPDSVRHRQLRLGRRCCLVLQPLVLQLPRTPQVAAGWLLSRCCPAAPSDTSAGWLLPRCSPAAPSDTSVGWLLSRCCL